MASKSGVVTVIDNMAQLVEGIRLLGTLHPMVGIPEDKTDRDEDDPQHDSHKSGEQSIGNAALLYIHDQGAPEVGIPQREVMRPGVKNATPEIEHRLVLAGKAALDGKPQSVRNQMAAAGQAGASAVKAMINSNVQPPLAEGTLEARKRRGVKRTNTLVDTAQMRNAVTYVVREDK